jgi:hypothetical protein
MAKLPKYSTVEEFAAAIKREGRGHLPATPEDQAEMLWHFWGSFIRAGEEIGCLVDQIQQAEADRELRKQQSLAREIAHALEEQNKQTEPEDQDGPKTALAKQLLKEIYLPNGIPPYSIQAKEVWKAICDKCEERGLRPPGYDIVRHVLRKLGQT